MSSKYTTLVGLSGCHGTGKTTVLNALKARGLSVVEGSLARIAQAKLGIKTVTEAPSLLDALQLQFEIFYAMADRDRDILRNSDAEIVFVDRSPVDVYGYTHLWLMENAKALAELPIKEYERISDEARHLFAKLEQHGRDTYNHIIVFPLRDEIPFVAENNRANIQSRNYTATLMAYAGDLIEYHRDSRADVYQLKKLDVEERVDEILARVKRYGT